MYAILSQWSFLCCTLSDPQAFKYNPSQPFSDPAIMSASPLVPPQQSVHNGNFTNAPAPAGTFVSPGPASFGPPPGLAYPPGIIPAPMLSGRQASNGPPAGLEISHPAGSAHGEFLLSLYQGRQSQVRVPSGVLSVRKLYHRP